MYSPDTVTEALVYLRGEGYTADFSLADGHLTCGGTVLCSVVEADVDRLFRFEGDSDPGDEMVVFALVDLASGTKGTLASAFGPAADPELLDHLVGLHTRSRSGISRDSIDE
ncbi:MAG: phosphoribosylpyrophosphate synthetase [Aquihabitans sp.]